MKSAPPGITLKEVIKASEEAVNENKKIDEPEAQEEEEELLQPDFSKLSDDEEDCDIRASTIKPT